MVSVRTRRAAVLLVLLACTSSAFAGIDLVVAIDQSGSMWGNPAVHPGSNDPWRHRIGATKEIVFRLMQNAADTGAVHRLSVVEFADEAKVPLSAQVIRFDKTDPSSLDRVRAALESAVTAKDWGNTNTAAALESSLAEFRKMRPSDPPGPRRRVLLLITDGRPMVPGVDAGTLRSRIRGVAAQLAAEGIELWVVGLNDADDYWTASDGVFWESVAGRDHARLAENASSAMPSIFQVIVSDWIGVRMIPVRGNQYDCPPYLRRLVFHATFARPGGDLRIHDPDGNVVPRTAGGAAVAPGTFALFQVDDPKPGTYTITRDPMHAVTVSAEEVSPSIERLEPHGESDTGVQTPFVFVARRASGDPLQVLPEHPIDARVTVSDSRGSRVELPANVEPHGRFVTTWKPARPGHYDAVLHGFVRRTDGSSYDIFANSGGSYPTGVETGRREPYSLRLVEPDPVKGLRTLPWRRNAALTFELIGPKGDLVKEPNDVVMNPSTWLTIQSLDPSGMPIGPVVPVQMTDGRFLASIPLLVSWRKGEGLWRPGTFAFRIAAVSGRLTGQRYLRSVVLPAGLEERRIDSDPLSAGPLDVRLANWAWILVASATVASIAILLWLLCARWLHSMIHHVDRGRIVVLRVYDEVSDPTALSSVEFGVSGKKSANLPVQIDVEGQLMNADRFRFVRELSDRRPRGTLQYRWRGNRRTYTTRLSAGYPKSLDGLPGGNYVALLAEQPQQ